MPAEDSFLQLEGISKSYPDRRKAAGFLGHRHTAKKVLTGISLSIPAKRATILLGPNGSGKTTLLKLMAGLFEPDLGTVKRPYACSLLPDSERTFYWRLSGRQNLRFFASLQTLSNSRFEERLKDIQKILNLTDLDARYQEYSAGMKQQLALARLMLSDAPVLLLDEPTKSLDPDRTAVFFQWMKLQIRPPHSKSVILATHDLHEAQLIADHILILDDGRLAASGSLDDLRLRLHLPGASLETLYHAVREQTV